MQIEISNRVDGRTSVEEFGQIRRELVNALAAYLIEHDLVTIEARRGKLYVSVDINLKKK
jgi:hypothetical protein